MRSTTGSWTSPANTGCDESIGSLRWSRARRSRCDAAHHYRDSPSGPNKSHKRRILDNFSSIRDKARPSGTSALLPDGGLTLTGDARGRGPPSHQRRQTPLAELVRDDHPLHLAGALPDPLHPQLAVEPLGDVLAHVAAAAKDLHGTIGHPVGHLRGVQLDHRAATVQQL